MTSLTPLSAMSSKPEAAASLWAVSCRLMLVLSREHSWGTVWQEEWGAEEPRAEPGDMGGCAVLHCMSSSRPNKTSGQGGQRRWRPAMLVMQLHR